MRVLGLNAKNTATGKQLIDGAVCIIENGEIIVALAEERITRKKHAGGYYRTLDFLLKNYSLDINDFDSIVLSSCCEKRSLASHYPELKLQNIEKLNVILHHESHAYSTYFASPFTEAIIIVMDAGGNIIDSDNGSNNYNNWWMARREQNSYFIGHGNNITLLERDFEEPFSVGFGEAYRAFTYYLGWHSHRYSANTMALAAYGNPLAYRSSKLFHFNQTTGKLVTHMTNNPYNPIKMVLEWAVEQGVDKKIPEPRYPNSEITQKHMDLAWFIQNELENALTKKVDHLVEETGIRNICIAGGVGLNCVANRKILDVCNVDNLFIQPAAGDQGQALGNAYYGYYKVLNNHRVENKCFSPYLGFKQPKQSEILSQLKQLSVDVKFDSLSSFSEIAEMLSKGKIIGWYQGRSEYGPRALGNRSILADPRQRDVEQRLRRIKGREEFRPFAPSVIEEEAKNFFDIEIPSPYMLLTAKAKKEIRDLIPGVLHIDFSARLQTVSKKSNPIFHELLFEFYKITGIPLLLNTSFNGRGEAIVESPIDALYAFLELGLDALVIGKILIQLKPTQIESVDDLINIKDPSYKMAAYI